MSQPKDSSRTSPPSHLCRQVGPVRQTFLLPSVVASDSTAVAMEAVSTPLPTPPLPCAPRRSAPYKPPRPCRPPSLEKAAAAVYALACSCRRAARVLKRSAASYPKLRSTALASSLAELASLLGRSVVVWSTLPSFSER